MRKPVRRVVSLKPKKQIVPTQTWAQYLSKKLVEPDIQRLARMKTRLLEANQALGNPGNGFTFGGEFHTNIVNYQKQKNVAHVPLHPSLNGEMIAFLQDRKKVNEDQLRMEQILTLSMLGLTVRGQGTQAQDLRDVIPEILLEYIEEERVTRLPRTRPEAYTLLDNPTAMKQYQKHRSLFEIYTISRMLF